MSKQLKLKAISLPTSPPLTHMLAQSFGVVIGEAALTTFPRQLLFSAYNLKSTVLVHPVSLAVPLVREVRLQDTWSEVTFSPSAYARRSGIYTQEWKINSRMSLEMSHNMSKDLSFTLYTLTSTSWAADSWARKDNTAAIVKENFMLISRVFECLVCLWDWIQGWEFHQSKIISLSQ